MAQNPNDIPADEAAEEREWDELVSSPDSQKWLELAADKALAEYKRGETVEGDPSEW